MRKAAIVLIAMALLATNLAAPQRVAANEHVSYCHELAGGWAPRKICISSADFFVGVCRAIEVYAERWTLPAAFLARLIWQESRFDPNAISHAGAQGIAQFMPGTAQLRGLKNPFQPAEALARSAEYLRELEQKFGNLGLAAAAYNGGEGAVSRWKQGAGGLAGETREYVQIITGRSVEAWRQPKVEAVDFELDAERSFMEGCVEMTKVQPMPRLEEPSLWKPWGVQVAQNFSEGNARDSFERARARFKTVLGEEKLLLLPVKNPNFGRRQRYSAQIGRDSRSEAEKLCDTLRAAGGACVVTKN